MAIPMSKLDRFKIETEFGDRCVVQTTYGWKYSARSPEAKSKWIEVQKIGAGAFGSVWLEKEETRGELRAVKRLQRHSLDKKNFSQELLVMIMLADHKHLFVEFLGWYETDRDIFLAMEYLQYGDLSGYMANHQRAKEEASEVTHQILEALRILHGENICHRDLKPANILVASLDPIWVKLADFGVSKRTNNTFLRTWCGTQGYLAPELLGLLPRGFEKGAKYTYALDLWSLGCIVHQLLTTQIPFLETYDEDDDDEMTGLDTSCEMVDMTSLHEYCHGITDFSSEILRASHAPQGGIELVQSLLVAKPSERATAAGALMNPWVAEPAYTSRWCEDLESEFSGLGLKLLLPRDPKLRKQLRSVDIATVLPATTNLLYVLYRSINQGYDTAASIILRSASLGGVDNTVAQDLLDRACAAGLANSVKILLSLAKHGILASTDQLLNAVQAGQLEIVQVFLDNKVDVNSAIAGRRLLRLNAQGSFKGDQTALQTAAARGHFEMVKMLLDGGADINARGSARGAPTALQVAIESGHLEIVKLLLDRKADINARTSFPRTLTALQTAAASGHLAIVQLLLDRKADINDPGGPGMTGQTALQAAAGGEDLAVVQLLLDNNADVNAPGLRTALQVAAGRGRLEVVKLLLASKADINAHGSSTRDQTALESAAGRGHLEIVRLLLDNEADIDAHGHHTALQAAARHGHLEVVQLLLDNNANVNSPPDSDGSTVLMTAMSGKHVEIVELLLKHDADPNTTASGWTPLQIAVKDENVNIVELLVSYGANVNGIATNKDPALLIATKGCNSVLVQLLLDHGATMNGPDMMAEITSYGHDDVVLPDATDDSPAAVSQYGEIWKALKFW